MQFSASPHDNRSALRCPNSRPTIFSPLPTYIISYYRGLFLDHGCFRDRMGNPLDMKEQSSAPRPVFGALWPSITSIWNCFCHPLCSRPFSQAPQCNAWSLRLAEVQYLSVVVYNQYQQDCCLRLHGSSSALVRPSSGHRISLSRR